MKARLITRCGCERIIEVPCPPPPTFYLPLLPPKVNQGVLRPWMHERVLLDYDPKRDGTARVFKLSLESLAVYERWGDDKSMVWYDETTVFDPPGFDPDKRTYNELKACGKEGV